jgi:hypothetical protein
MNKTLLVTDKYMIMALKESKKVFEETGYRRSDEEIEDRTEYFRNMHQNQ